MRKSRMLIIMVTMVMLVNACSLTSPAVQEPGAESTATAEGTAAVAESLVETMNDDNPAAEAPEEPAEDNEIDTEDNKQPASGVCFNSFYPIRDDKVWTYRSDAGGDVSTYQQTFSNVSADGFTVVTMFDGNSVEVSWECTEDGLISSEFLNFSFIPDANFDLSTNDFSGIWIPDAEDWVVGKEWGSTYSVDLVSEMEGMSFETGMTLELTNTITAIESVSVVAGDYAEAYRVDTTGIMVIEDLGTESPIEYSSWFVRDVGMVRSAMVSMEGFSDGGYNTELISVE